jgi:hypothetical protein
MYKITVTLDERTRPDFTFEYSDAKQAFHEFSLFKDWGFSENYQTVNLSMPTGKMYTKVLHRDGRIFER